jgi:hypothetical protein
MTTSPSRSTPPSSSSEADLSESAWYEVVAGTGARIVIAIAEAWPQRGGSRKGTYRTIPQQLWKILRPTQIVEGIA